MRDKPSHVWSGVLTPFPLDLAERIAQLESSTVRVALEFASSLSPTGEILFMANGPNVADRK